MKVLFLFLFVAGVASAESVHLHWWANDGDERFAYAEINGFAGSVGSGTVPVSLYRRLSLGRTESIELPPGSYLLNAYAYDNPQMEGIGAETGIVPVAVLRGQDVCVSLSVGDGGWSFGAAVQYLPGPDYLAIFLKGFFVGCGFELFGLLLRTVRKVTTQTTGI